MNAPATIDRSIWPGRALLGEGPVWDAARAVLWFVDIKSCMVHRLDPATGVTRAWRAPAPVGWVLPAADGLLLAGLKTGIARFDPEAETFDLIAEIEADLPDNRLNDATTGPDGCVWFGSMDDTEGKASGCFYRWDGDAVVRLPIDPVTVSNGPAVSPDGRILYHVDTLGGTIRASTIGADGSVGETRVFARIDRADGYPDGVTADSAGNVWVGLWGGWRARLYAPDGSILTEVRLPTANVTKVALGGPDLRTAFVTTASVGLDDQPEAQAMAGQVFAFPVETAGQRPFVARLPAGR